MVVRHDTETIFYTGNTLPLAEHELRERERDEFCAALYVATD